MLVTQAGCFKCGSLMCQCGDDSLPHHFRRIAIGMYVGEPCRICGIALTREDIEAEAVFVGYSQDNTSRAAHKACWDKGLPQEEWAKR